jgi:chaperonin GroEL (HSP60 family)
VLDSGFKFNIAVDKKYITNKTRKMSNVKCFVIDGFIESVSEIHHLLEEASRTKENYVIFFRHMNEDVQSTIEYNIQRGTINLIPVSVGFDENTLNILNDISICTNSELISSHKGDIISQSIRKDPVIVDSIEFLKDSISIINKTPSDMLKSHLRYLRDKR